MYSVCAFQGSTPPGVGPLGPRLLRHVHFPLLPCQTDNFEHTSRSLLSDFAPLFLGLVIGQIRLKTSLDPLGWIHDL